MYQRASCQGCPRGGGIFADIALEASPGGYAALKTPGSASKTFSLDIFKRREVYLFSNKYYYSGVFSKNILYRKNTSFSSLCSIDS